MKPIVCVNYFSGWWPEGSSKWLDPIDGHDWRPEYVSRIPLHGFYNSQDTMNRDIVAASENGIDCFQMLWYPVDSPDTVIDEPHRVHLNEGIAFLMQSPYADRMHFLLEYCNHPPFAITDRAEWKRTCAIWAEMLAHPSCLRIDGRPLFKIHGLWYFFQQCGENWDVMRDFLSDLREAIREATGANPILSGGITEESPEFLRPFLEHFDYFATYMNLPAGNADENDHPYTELGEFALQAAQRYGEAGIPYQPYLPAGWNPRPWHDPRFSYTIPTGNEIERMATHLCELLEQYPSLGISAKNTLPAFSVYAWNEFGEGGYLAPTLIEQDNKLRGLARALGLTQSSKNQKK